MKSNGSSNGNRNRKGALSVRSVKTRDSCGDHKVRRKNMTTAQRYESAREIYKNMGVDTDKAVETLKNIPVSMHCWQGDDVQGFDHEGPLSGGIQTTGNYPGKARTPEELMEDIDKALSLIPGKHKLNLHANYAIFEDGCFADRDALKPEHFKR